MRQRRLKLDPVRSIIACKVSVVSVVTRSADCIKRVVPSCVDADSCRVQVVSGAVQRRGVRLDKE